VLVGLRGSGTKLARITRDYDVQTACSHLVLLHFELLLAIPDEPTFLIRRQSFELPRPDAKLKHPRLPTMTRLS
jgi:hypothetical protein